jgi:hypothetical protein
MEVSFVTVFFEVHVSRKMTPRLFFTILTPHATYKMGISNMDDIMKTPERPKKNGNGDIDPVRVSFATRLD